MKEFKIRINSRDDFEKVHAHAVSIGYTRMHSGYEDYYHALYLTAGGGVFYSDRKLTYRDCEHQEITVNQFLKLTKKDTQSEPVGANNPAGERS